MSILDNFKSVFNNKNKKEFHEPSNISSSEFYNQTVHIPESIYENPTPSSIAHNITSKQTFALSYLLDMAYVAATADNSFYLPKPYKVAHAGKFAKIFEEKFNSDIAFTNEYYKKNIKVSRKLDNYIKPRKELFEIIQTVYPGFCHNMENKISHKDYEFYRKNKTSLKKCLHYKETYSDTVSSKDVLLGYQDNLANIIDTLDFSKACKIEDSFVASELITFFDKFSELSDEDKKTIMKHKIKLNNGTIKTLDFAKKLLDERNNRIAKYSSIENLYKKIDEKTHIQLTSNPSKKEVAKQQTSPDDSER
jgi:hypothetical protein